MGFNVRVPGGWVGTRSSGVRAGPLSYGHAYKRRRRRRSDPMTVDDWQNIGTGIGYLAKLPLYLLLAPLWLVWQMLRLLWWLVKIAVWIVGFPIIFPIWLIRRHRRIRQRRQAFANPPTGFRYDPLTGRVAA